MSIFFSSEVNINNKITVKLSFFKFKIAHCARRTPAQLNCAKSVDWLVKLIELIHYFIPFTHSINPSASVRFGSNGSTPWYLMFLGSTTLHGSTFSVWSGLWGVLSVSARGRRNMRERESSSEQSKSTWLALLGMSSASMMSKVQKW